MADMREVGTYLVERGDTLFVVCDCGWESKVGDDIQAMSEGEAHVRTTHQPVADKSGSGEFQTPMEEVTDE